MTLFLKNILATITKPNDATIDIILTLLYPFILRQGLTRNKNIHDSHKTQRIVRTEVYL